MVAECDIIVSSGGVSMGERDLIKGTIVELGGTVHFGRVQMKPGKPTTFATLQRPGTDDYIGFFGLPGISHIYFHVMYISLLINWSYYYYHFFQTDEIVCREPCFLSCDFPYICFGCSPCFVRSP